MRPCLLAALLVVFITPSARALPPPSTANAARLITLLGSPSFPEREAAQKALEAMGERALTTLKRAAGEAQDPEVRKRAAALIQVMEPIAQRKRLQGRWEVVAWVAVGRDMMNDVRRAEYVFTGERVRTTVELKIGATETGDFEFAVSRKTGQHTITFFGPNGSILIAAIYKLEGDTLTLCMQWGKQAWPKEFDGKKSQLITLKRVPPMR